MRWSVGKSQAVWRPGKVESRGGKDHRCYVSPWGLKGKLRQRTGVFRWCGGQWVCHQRRQRGSTCVAFNIGLVGSRNRGGDGAREEGPHPIVLKDLDRQCGHQWQQPVGDVSQDQLLVSIAADTNMGRASLEQMRGDNVGETAEKSC